VCLSLIRPPYSPPIVFCSFLFSLFIGPLPRGVMACVRVTFRLCFVSKPSENSVYTLIV